MAEMSTISYDQLPFQEKCALDAHTLSAKGILNSSNNYLAFNIFFHYL